MRQWNPDQEAFTDATRLENTLQMYVNGLQSEARPKRVAALALDEVLRQRKRIEALERDARVLVSMYNRSQEELWQLKRHWFFRLKFWLRDFFRG